MGVAIAVGKGFLLAQSVVSEGFNVGAVLAMGDPLSTTSQTEGSRVCAARAVASRGRLASSSRTGVMTA